jgi:hypothetical protein
MMRIVLALLLGAHGFAHVVGFLVTWRLVKSTDVPYHTTILNGAVDLGHAGIRLYGVAWLLLAAAFVAVAAGLWLQAPWWYAAGAAAVAASLLFCMLGWPETRIGLLVNILLIGLAVMGQALSRWPV